MAAAKKKCDTCERTKAIKVFRRSKAHPDGHLPTCQPCRAAATRELEADRAKRRAIRQGLDVSQSESVPRGVGIDALVQVESVVREMAETKARLLFLKGLLKAFFEKHAERLKITGKVCRFGSVSYRSGKLKVSLKPDHAVEMIDKP